jgi:hypothetical protein
MAYTNSSPSDLKRITLRITALLGQYWTGDDSPDVRALIIRDWLTDVGEFTPEIVDEACDEWRQGPERRRKPLSGDIRAICTEAQANRVLKLAPRTEMIEEEISELADAWARSQGHPSMLAFQRSSGFSGCVIKIAPGRFRRFDPIETRIEAEMVVVPTRPGPWKRPTPQWYVERDQQRDELQRQKLGLDRIDAAMARSFDLNLVGAGRNKEEEAA